MLLAELFLCVAQVGLRLGRHERPGGPNLSLDGGDGLAGHLADGVRDAWDVGHRRHLGAELLDPRSDSALVITRLGEVLAQALLVGHLLGERDVRGEVGLELGFFGVRLVEPLGQLCIARVQTLLRQGLAPF
jgi:hypothetical protein